MPSPPLPSGARDDRAAAALEPHLRWWEGVASPGPVGYAIAVALSLPVLGALGAVVEGLAHGGDDPGGTFLAIVLFGAVLAVGLAAVVPLVPGVRRRRAAREERRRGPGADFGPTGHPG